MKVYFLKNTVKQNEKICIALSQEYIDKVRDKDWRPFDDIFGEHERFVIPWRL
jgi:hypothetical protein